MTTDAKTRPKKASRSGPNIPESQRPTRTLVLRVEPADFDQFGELASKFKSRKAAFGAAVAALRDAKDRT